MFGAFWPDSVGEETDSFACDACPGEAVEEAKEEGRTNSAATRYTRLHW